MEECLTIFWWKLSESGRWMEGVRNVLKVGERNKSVKEWAYQESLHGNMRC